MTNGFTTFDRSDRTGWMVVVAVAFVILIGSLPIVQAILRFMGAE